MQNTKNSKEVPGTGIASEKLHLLREITKEFENWTDYEALKEGVDYLLLGWISGDAMEYHAIYRAEIFSFFTNLLTQIKKVYDKDESIAAEYYNWTLDQKPKKIKFYFKSTLTAFIESEYANDRSIRTKIHYDIVELWEYFKKIHKINRKHKLQTA